ncbi:zona pellucida sperm-binding protein 3-like [Conger conger]|uniref:zona pellucida sperm-binding protein 3-like n=1 Tax=Conger conger TaxID=82655 RepID=UPI002A5AFAF0|nr:zona pellucida sperm-binding protein 3-like [Conger conger]
MGSERVYIGFLVLGVLGYLCDAQEGKPVYTQAPVVALPTFKPAYTMAPVVARPTFSRPAYTPAPVVARPTFSRPAYTQAPVVALPAFSKPAYTPAPVVARPTFSRPAYTPAPVVARPTFSRPAYTQAPVVALPAFSKPAYTPAPVVARPTFSRPAYTPAPVVARPTFSRPAYTQAPVVALPAFSKPAYTPAPVVARPAFSRPAYTPAPVVARPTFKPAYTPAPVTARPTLEGPTAPKIPVEAPTPNPIPAKVHCGESSVQVEVDMDLLGIGHVIQPSDITLGGCSPVAQDESAQVLLFETELHGCGSVLAMTETSLFYTFTLTYQPQAIGATPIIRTSSAVVGLQCHYSRLHNVSSNALNPTWVPYYSTVTTEELLVFSLRIMDDNWQLERPSNVFFLGDLINIEASVVQAHHVPLRVFVDACVATLEPDMNAVPRYPFIEGKGCLMDSKLTNSRSHFLSRVQDNKLQFQLDGFRFAQETRSTLYIFCHLKAIPDSDGKACSFPLGQQRWIEASGNDQKCSCCDSGCSGRKGRSVDSAIQYEFEAALRPVIFQEATKDAVESHNTLKMDHEAQGASEAVFMAGVMAAVALVCIIVLVLVLVWRRYKRVVL